MHLVTNDRPRRPRKTHTAEFKGKIAKEFLNSSATYSEVGRKFGVTCHQVARWTREYNDPSTRWVKELYDQTQNDDLIDNSLIENEKTEYASKEFDSNFNVDVSLPSGTIISIHNITLEQLINILTLCRDMG